MSILDYRETAGAVAPPARFPWRDAFSGGSGSKLASSAPLRPPTPRDSAPSPSSNRTRASGTRPGCCTGCTHAPDASTEEAYRTAVREEVAAEDSDAGQIAWGVRAAAHPDLRWDGLYRLATLSTPSPGPSGNGSPGASSPPRHSTAHCRDDPGVARDVPEHAWMPWRPRSCRHSSEETIRSPPGAPRCSGSHGPWTCSPPGLASRTHGGCGWSGGKFHLAPTPIPHRTTLPSHDFGNQALMQATTRF